MDASALLVGVGTMTDPVVLFEVGVVIGCVVWFAWWFSPAQRRRRLRQAARARAEVRRQLREDTTVTGEGNRK